MNRFNLTFSGELVAGHDPELAKARMAQVLDMDDPDLLQRCFSGNTVVLRRNLERREAAELYARLRRIGIHAELVKIGERGDLHAGEKVGSPTRQQADAGGGPQTTSPVEQQGPPAAEKTPPRQCNRPNGGSPSPQILPRPNPPWKTVSRPRPLPRSRQPRRTAEARRADRAAQKHLQAEEAALLDAKEKTLRKALKAKEREAAKRAKASERARQKTLAREAQHKAKLEAAKLKAAQEEAKAQASARQAAERAERERKAAQERARAQAELEEQQAQRRAMEEQAMARAAGELAQKTTLKPVEARVRTRLETPSRRRGPADETRRKRQPGAPNLYSLTPFRNTPEVRARPAQSERIMRTALIGSAIAFALALLLAVRLLTLPAQSPVAGAASIAVSPQERPLLLAGDRLLLHDRAGVSAADLTPADLGLATLQAPMAFDSSGKLLLPGVLASAAPTPVQPRLLQCDLDTPGCEVFPGQAEATQVSALTVHPLDGTLFVADSVNGELLKLSAAGELLARAPLDLPEHPVLKLDSGLLLTNSPAAPGIRVLRYEDEAFGQQLDEIVLLPPDADGTGFTGVRDFIWNGEHWWVLLQQAGDGASGSLSL